MTPVEIPDQRFQTPPAARTGIASATVVSVMLHALAALLLAGGFDGHRPPEGVEAVEVELVTLADPVEPEPLPVPEEQDATVEPEDETPPEPEAETPPEAAIEPDPQPETLPAGPEEGPGIPEIPVLQPVIEFGDEDTAPEGSEQGEPQQAEGPKDTEDPQETVETAETPIEEAEAPVDQTEPEPAGTGTQEPQDLAQALPPEETNPADPAAEDGPQAEPLRAEIEAAANPVEIGPSQEPEKLAVAPEASDEVAPATAPENASENTSADTDAPVAPSVLGDTRIAAIPRSKPPAPRRPDASEPQGEGLQPARSVLSGELLADARVRTAMRGMAEPERLNLLCATELRAQLNAQNPPILPDLLPTFQTPPGLTVLRPNGAAFRSFGIWHEVDFRCVVDPGVTRVESFSMKVGRAIPRSQWQRRGFPAF